MTYKDSLCYFFIMHHRSPTEAKTKTKKDKKIKILNFGGHQSNRGHIKNK